MFIVKKFNTLPPSIFAILLFGSLVVLGWNEFSMLRGRQDTCTREAKLCPDGSYVRQTGNDCQFETCPAMTLGSGSTEFDNDQVEQAITDYLLTQSRFAWKTASDSHNFCAIENLDPEKDLFPYSVWAYCGEFSYKNGQASLLSGVSLPVRVSYPNELSFYDTGRFTYQAPGDATYTEDMKKIFSLPVQKKISEHDNTALAKELETQALSWFQSRKEAWDNIAKALEECQVAQVSQTHDLEVRATLKNGVTLNATEPAIDTILQLVRVNENRCGQVPVATE